jgi:hypothetical protein
MGVSQARVPQIEHGKVTDVDAIRGYVQALGGTVDVVARVATGRSGSHERGAEMCCYRLHGGLCPH